MAIYYKINTFLFFLFTFVLFHPNSTAQEATSYWQVDYAQGSILKHRKTLGYLFTERPEHISIAWHKTAKSTSEWKERYNYPDWGLVFIYQRFNNENLGTSVAVNYTTTFYLRDRNAKNQLNVQLGFGAGYNTNPFNFETNLANLTTSSYGLYAQHLKLNYARTKIVGKFGLQAGLCFTHFSNGSFKKPNLGINSVFLNMGINYYNNKAVSTYERLAVKEKFLQQTIHFNLSLNAGFHETNPGLGTKFVYFASAYAHKRIGLKSGLQIGVDFYNSQSVKEFAYYQHVSNIEQNESKLIDHKQIGVFLGHEMFFNKLSLETQVGYYVYKPLSFHPSIYQKTSFKYFLNKRKSALSVNLKFHNFEAEFISFGLHHQLF